MDSALALEAILTNLHGYLTFIPRCRPGMVVDDSDDLLLVDSGLPNDAFNKVARARLTEDTADRRIAEATGHFHKAGRPFTWQVGPCSLPLDLEKRLANHGLRAAREAVMMTSALDCLPEVPEKPDGVEVRRVHTVAELAEFCAVVADNRGQPDPSVGVFYGGTAPVLLEEACSMRLFIARIEGSVAGGAELYLGGGVAGIYRTSCRAAFQGRGVKEALVWAALREARTLGVPSAVLETPEEHQGVYARLGFAPAFRFIEYQ